MFNKTRQNIENNEAAIKLNDFGSKEQIEETSIGDMIKLMDKYVIPPQHNFKLYSDIDPFIMYIFEFKHILDKQDLADIWQGVMPKIAETAEKEEVILEHKTGKFEFFEDRELPENIRWMIFKIKRKAEWNYYSITTDAEDDNRFQFDFNRGRGKPDYNFNWPFDMFSLVEFAKISLNLDFKNKDTEDKLVQSNTNTQISEIVKNTKQNKGKKKKNIF